ncbi:hypothetical protein, partial [Massilia sp. TSP1-1-2]|uniref:hypothetical protein n=1 Tax=Massilia sp. TSP1-1-2 TaxID=2804649 RepID=UPI003CEFA06D
KGKLGAREALLAGRFQRGSQSCVIEKASNVGILQGKPALGATFGPNKPHRIGISPRICPRSI